MDSRIARAAPVAITAIVVYGVVGYTVFPALLAPLGCTGAVGDIAVDHAPEASFDIAHDAGNDTLTVQHTGRDTLPADRTDRLTIRVTTEEAERTTTWTAAGGRFPVRQGDTVRLTERRLPDGSVVRVEWSGSWPDPQPNYCPNDHPTETSVTLAKRVF